MKNYLNIIGYFLIFILIVETKVLGITIASTSFNGTIGLKYVCEDQGGKNVSPRLIISDIPKNTKSLVLLVEDPDARAVVGKTYIHLVSQLSPPKGASYDLPEGALNEKSLGKGIKVIKNDAGISGYYGPCPPKGTHSYFFTVVALSDTVNISENTLDYFRNTWNYKNSAEASRFYKDNKDNVIEIAQTVGKYKRNSEKK